MKNEYWFVLILLLVGIAAWIVRSENPPLREGLDLKGGVRVVLQIDMAGAPKGSKATDVQQQSITILRKRVDAFGVSEPVIQPKGTDQIIVELPGIKDKVKAVKDLQSTAQLQFRYLRDVVSERNPNARYEMSTIPSKTPGGKDEFRFEDTRNGRRILTPEEVQRDVIDQSPLIVSGGELLPTAKQEYNPSDGRPVVTLEFNNTGAQKFGDFTRTHEKELLAIILDSDILMAPRINEPILNGRAEISGNMTVGDAARLSGLLNAGALPAPLKQIAITEVDATLGKDSVDAARKAGMVGFALVLLFMLLYYRLPGLLADVALVFYAIFTLAAFKLVPVTLTLPGIAGFILSIGMAVDANILIFERLKEELRTGKTLKAAIDAGFHRAWSSIRDSNICSLITAAILFNFGTGPIKGFALTLGVGVVISMFTAIFVTRTMLHLLINWSFAQNPSLYGLGMSWVSRQGGRWFDIIGKRNWYFVLSGAVIVPGLIFLSMGGLKKGIDFTGGSVVQVQFQKTAPASITDIRAAAAGPGIEVGGIQASQDNTYFVRTNTLTMPQYRDMVDRMAKVAPVVATNFDSVGAVVSKELTQNALWAVIWSALLIIIYLTYQFRQAEIMTGLKYGISAILATFHDVLVLLGVFAILGHFLKWEVDSLFVTAVLTVIGFSTHDTIVIFDRIRENWKHREKDENYEHVVNRSILQTFARSINTSFTVVLTLTALLVLGGSTIHLLNAALLIGVISGTYSSIFNASPLLVVWDGISRRRQLAARRPGESRAMVSAPVSVAAPKPKPMVQAAAPTDSETETASDAGKTKIKPKRKRRF